jgi:hypothetical protein
MGFKRPDRFIGSDGGLGIASGFISTSLSRDRTVRGSDTKCKLSKVEKGLRGQIEVLISSP